MVTSGVERERGGNHEQVGPGQGQTPVQLGKSQVVADRQADLPFADITGDQLISWRDSFGLAISDTIRDVDVKEVDLLVARQDGAIRTEDD